MSSSDVELAKMIRGFRVSDLQALLTYAGRNKGGKKYDLQSRALDLIKLRSSAIDMKIREIHHNKYSHSRTGHSEPAEMYPGPSMSDYSSGYNSRSGAYGSGSSMPSYLSAMGKHLMPPALHMSMMSQYPVNPDVKFSELPFYDVLAELLKPTSLVTIPNPANLQEREVNFCFTPQQVNELTRCQDVLVQLRIALLDSSCEQDDEIPSSICLKVNSKLANLPNAFPLNKPGAEPRRPKHPIDITYLIKRTAHEANHICISWASASGKPFVMGVYLVRKQSSNELIRRLKNIGVRNPDHTTAMIKEKLSPDRDSEIATMSLRGSLMCPLGKTKMKLPCRALTCSHLQCFDGSVYLQMNEKRPKWICPVCDKPAFFKNLAIDGLFLDIVMKAPENCTEVQFHKNGSWTPVIPTVKPDTIIASPKPPKVVEKAPPKKSVEVISLDSGSDTEEDSYSAQPPKKKVYNPDMSPVLVCEDSNDNTGLSEDVCVTSYDPYGPSTSKALLSPPIPSFSRIIPNIPAKESLPPLPTTLDIDTTEVENILTVHKSSAASTSSEQSMPVLPSGTTFHEKTEQSSTANQNFSSYDFFSILNSPDAEGSDAFETANLEDQDQSSPDIINID